MPSRSQTETDKKYIGFNSDEVEKPDTSISRLSIKTIIVPPSTSKPLWSTAPVPFPRFQNERNSTSVYKTAQDFYKHSTSFINETPVQSASVIISRSPEITFSDSQFVTDEDNGIELEDRVDLNISLTTKDNRRFQVYMNNTEPEFKSFEKHNPEICTKFLDEIPDSSPVDFYNRLKFKFIPSDSEFSVRPISCDFGIDPFLRYNTRVKDSENSKLPKLLPSTPSLSRKKRTLPEHYKEVKTHQENILEELHREIQEEEERNRLYTERCSGALPHCIESTDEFIHMISK